MFSSSLPDISQISRSEISIPHEILKKGRKEEDARQTDDFAERANVGPLFGWIQGKTRVKVGNNIFSIFMVCHGTNSPMEKYTISQFFFKFYQFQ